MTSTSAWATGGFTRHTNALQIKLASLRFDCAPALPRQFRANRRRHREDLPPMQVYPETNTFHTMSDPPFHLPSRQTFLLIVIPLLATFASQRLYLHFVGIQHVYPGGYLVHHLFFGVLIVLPAAFLLAFGPRRRRTAVLARVALGIGSAMILDEIVYLVATQATDADYISTLSLRGAVVFVVLGVILLWILYKIQPD